MSHAMNFSEQIPLVRQLKHWWHSWRNSRTAIAELGRCGPDEVERVARDVGVTGVELCILAGKWPNSASLLNRRMEYLKLDAADIARVEPLVMRDLRRVCTLCDSKRRCARDMVKNPFDPVWQRYCPNTMTLAALRAQRAPSTAASAQTVR